MKKRWLIGVDEVGRGPVAGPVTVCVVAMETAVYEQQVWVVAKKALGDSKKMTAIARNAWFAQAALWEKEGIVKSICVSRTAQDIDRDGIAACIRQCLVEGLGVLALEGVTPEHAQVLLDGSLHAPIAYEQETVIKGDAVHKIISLASVIAKVSRDRVMDEYAVQYPSYVWEKNKGYGTAAHYEAIKKYGMTPLHRRTFLKGL